MFPGIEVAVEGGGRDMSHNILESAVRERNAQAQQSPPTRNPTVHGPSRPDPGADRAVSAHFHDLRVRAVDRPKFPLSCPS
ncbi:hypothetical protein FIBSPDRAFT_877473, partial [Athelia psychrophila]